jgi:hypothetical protein
VSVPCRPRWNLGNRTAAAWCPTDGSGRSTRHARASGCSEVGSLSRQRPDKRGRHAAGELSSPGPAARRPARWRILVPGRAACGAHHSPWAPHHPRPAPSSRAHQCSLLSSVASCRAGGGTGPNRCASNHGSTGCPRSQGVRPETERRWCLGTPSRAAAGARSAPPEGHLARTARRQARRSWRRRSGSATSGGGRR